MTDLLENAESREKVEKLKEKVFYGMTAEEIAEAETLEINGCAEIEDGCLELLPVLENLKTLRMENVQCREENWLRFLTEMPNLTTVILTRCPIKKEDIQVLGSCRQLEELSLLPCCLTTESLMPIIQLTNLRILSLGNRVGAEFLEILENLPQLEEFYGDVRKEAWSAFFDLLETFPKLYVLKLAQNMNAKYFQRFTRLKHLEAFTFQCRTISEGQLNEINQLTELKYFKLVCTMPGGPRKIAFNLPKLEVLRLACTDIRQVDFTGMPLLEFLDLNSLEIAQSEGVVNLDTLVHLKEFELHTNEAPEIIRSLEMLPGLESLEVGESWRVNDELVQQVSQFPALQEVSFLNCEGLTPEGAQVFEKFENLIALSLQKAVQLTDSGLDFLKRMPKLKELGLVDFPVNDYDLQNLDFLPELEALRITNCSQLTQHSLNRICRLPKLESLILERGDFPELRIRDMPNLEALELKHWSFSACELSNLPCLEQLKLENGTEMETLRIQKLPMIRQLELKNLPKFVDFRLIESRDIQQLDLSRCDALDLFGLVSFHKLRDFSLTWEQLTGYGMRETLHEIPSLRTLRVTCKQIEPDAESEPGLAGPFDRQDSCCYRTDMMQISKEFSDCFILFQAEIER